MWTQPFIVAIVSDTTAHDGDTAKVSTLLSTQGAQSFINYQGTNGTTPIHCVSQKGHVSVTEQLIEPHYNIDLQAKERVTPLICAVHNGHKTVTEQLMTARCNVDLLGKYGFTPLHMTTQKGNETVTEQLIKACCNIDLHHNDGATAPDFIFSLYSVKYTVT